MPRSATDTCRSYLASFSSGNADEVAAHVTAGFVNEHTAALGSGCEGKDAYLGRLPGFIGSMPGLRYEVEDVIADTDGDTGRVCAAYTLHATVNDRPIAVRGVIRFDVEQGLIARRVDYWDSLVFQRQAGMA